MKSSPKSPSDDEDVGDVPYGGSHGSSSPPSEASPSPCIASGFGNGVLRSKLRQIPSATPTRGQSEPLESPIYHPPIATSPEPLEEPTQSGRAESAPAFPDLLPFNSTRSAQTMPYEVRDIVRLEGHFDSIASDVFLAIQYFCSTQQTQDLPCAVPMWKEATLGKTASGDSKIWTVASTGEELRLGRFRYGLAEQIVVAQGPPGSDWEGGRMVLLVFSGGNYKQHWKIWRGQVYLNQIPRDDSQVFCNILQAEKQGLSSQVDSGRKRQLDHGDGTPQTPKKLAKPLNQTHLIPLFEGQRERLGIAEGKHFTRFHFRGTTPGPASSESLSMRNKQPKIDQQTSVSSPQIAEAAKPVPILSHNPTENDDPEKISVFFLSTDSVGTAPVPDCTFSELMDIRYLFVRARVAGIASKDTILLEARFGDKMELVVKQSWRDFDRLKAAINESKATKVFIRDPGE